MGKYGNIDGIATLTHSTIAIDNTRGSIGKPKTKKGTT